MLNRFVCVVALCAAALYGQTSTSRVRGVVTDSSGALVPGASVTARNEGTGLERSMVTNASGQYSFDAMPLGKYSVLVSMSGFKKVQTHGNDLQVGEPLTVDVVLEPGTLSEEVSVTATAAQVQTAEASLGQVLDTKPI